MTTVQADQVRDAFTLSGLIDYGMLSKPESLAVFQPVFDELMKQAEEEFERLCLIPTNEVSFASVVEPYHVLDEKLKMAWLFLDSYHRTDGNEQTKSLVEYCQPKIVRFSDKLLLDERFYHALEEIWKKEADTLNESQRRSLELLIRDRKIAGVHLPPEQKTRLKEINEQLTDLAEKFSRNTIDGRAQFFYQFKTDETIKDMPQQDLDGALEEAKSRGLDGWVFTLSPPSSLAVMRYCTDGEIRKLFLEEGVNIGAKAPHDNRPMILDILALRKEKAALLGFQDFTGYALQNRIATLHDIRWMYEQFSAPYRAKAERDIAELKEFAGKDLSVWDVSYYSNKLMQQKLSINEAMLQEYFELEATLKGLFEIAKKLFNVELQPLRVSSYHPTIRSFDVTRNGTLIGHFIFDFFARPSKRAGAWCVYLRGNRKQTNGERVLPILINACNFPQGAVGKPTLLSHMDVRTLFHEFGHAIHELLSEPEYPNIDGLATELDFVELPSQLMENWCFEKDALSLYAKHYQTGELLPDDLLDALKKKRSFMSGYSGCQQLQFGLCDLELHLLQDPFQSVEELDAYCLKHQQSWSVLPIPDFWRWHASFSHVWEGEYAVGYYSYLWSEMLEADAFTVFIKEGVLNPEIGERYRSRMLKPGALESGKELFESFMGRGPDPGALLRKKGVV